MEDKAFLLWKVIRCWNQPPRVVVVSLFLQMLKTQVDEVLSNLACRKLLQ